MQPKDWSVPLSAHIYAESFMTDWLNTDHSGDRYWLGYEEALNTYLASQCTERLLIDRYTSLTDSLNRFKQLRAHGDSHLATRLALIRIHADLGEPQASVDEINQTLRDMPWLLNALPEDIHVATDRPFLAPFSTYDARPVNSSLSQWLKAAITDALNTYLNVIEVQSHKASISSEFHHQFATNEHPTEDKSKQPTCNSTELVEKANALDSKNHEQRADLFLKAIGLDRNCIPAYLGYAKEQKEKQTLQSFLALKEAQRLTQLPDEYQAMIDQMSIDSSDVRHYLERAGQTLITNSESPKKILVITNLFPPQEMGGFGRTMWEFCQALIQRGHDLRILTADMPHLYRKPSQDMPDIERYVKRDLRLYGGWENGKTFTDQDLEKIRTKIIHNHQCILDDFKRFCPNACLVGNLDFLGYEFLDSILHQNIPIIHRLGNALPGYPVEHTPKSPLFCLAGASEWLNLQLKVKGYSFPNMAVIHPASTLEFYYRYFPATFDTLRICFAGLLMPYKGAHLLLEALAALHRKGIPFTCEIAGDTTDSRYINHLKKLAEREGFSDRVHYPGFLNRAELAALYARSNVMVFPSIFDEPFGKSQIEAMAAGLAVISSGTGGAQEIIIHEKNGWIFDKNKTDDLSEKLAFIYKNPVRAKKVAACAIEDAFRFNTNNSVKKLEKTFDLLENRKNSNLKVALYEKKIETNNDSIKNIYAGTDIAYLAKKHESAMKAIPSNFINQSDSEIIKSELPIVIVRSHFHNYSETFIEDHINFISEKLTLIYGWPFPRYSIKNQSVVSKKTEKKLASAIKSGGGISNQLWNEYSQDLAFYLKKCDVKVALLESGVMGSFFYRACEILGLPYVVHFHGVDAFGKEILLQWQEHYKNFFRTAAKLIVVSKAMRAQLLRLGAPADKIVLGPCGVSLDLPELADPANAAPQFIAVGRFVEKKAPLNTLQAFAITHKAIPEARLIMVGDGPLLKPCKQWVNQNGLSDVVFLAGARSRRVVSALMAESRAFVQHSLTASNGDSEGMPVAILEAGAHGLPVISTRHAGIPDAVLEGKHGFLVNEGDIQGMAEYMIRIANEPEQAGIMGVAYREQIAKNFSREKSISRLQNVLSYCAS